VIFSETGWPWFVIDGWETADASIPPIHGLTVFIICRNYMLVEMV
jgi:hypothetical protein